MKSLSLFLSIAVALGATVPSAPLHAQGEIRAQSGEATQEPRSVWITLGTRGGPVASSSRSQPANLLRVGNRNYLVDAGDGTAGQLIKVGVPTAQIDAVLISHLHFDHFGGLQALLGLRWQTNAPRALRIYGPPGTRETVEGIVASMVPATTAGYGIPGAPLVPPQETIEVFELRDGDVIDMDGIAVTARSNTHYSYPEGSDLAQRFESLSLRFDMADRSIAYTGDTGPSSAVEELARGADLLVAEMMDVQDTIAMVRRNSPNLDAANAAAMEQHLSTHHLVPADVGILASRAEVGAVVVTHFVGVETGHPKHFEYLREIAEHFDGPVVIANDIQAF